MFGANIYVADLVGIGMTRQLGPLMTAIIVCGRSGAAYTTELGSMKVDEEIELPCGPSVSSLTAWLVVPRVLTLVLDPAPADPRRRRVRHAGGLFVKPETSLGLSPPDLLQRDDGQPGPRGTWNRGSS